MTTTLTSKGQVTIPKRIRDELQLLPGAPVQFSVNAAGEVACTGPSQRSAYADLSPTDSKRCGAAPTSAGGLTT